MKGKLIILLSILLIVFTSCDYGKVRNTKVIDVPSEIYDKEDILDAIEAAKRYFKHAFTGCELLEIYYAGDDSYDELTEWADQYNEDEAIILLSDFYVGPDGGDGSLNTDSTYEDCICIFVHNDNGRWRHKTHGY